MIITNVWAMLRDPEVYHDPDTFKPERFLREEYTDEEGNVHVLREAEPHPSEQGVFGFGRRYVKLNMFPRMSHLSSSL